MVVCGVQGQSFLAVNEFLSSAYLCEFVCHLSALLVFQDLCGGVPACLLTTVGFSSIRKRIPLQLSAPIKGAAHKPPECDI